jgi:putative membrane protein
MKPYHVAAWHSWGQHAAWWPIFPVIWLALTALVVVASYRWFTGRGRIATTATHGAVPHSAIPHAEGLLAERFARGEIEEDEYRERLMALRAFHD